MRKILIVIISMILCSSSVFAADALYRMLHADEVASFAEDQDAIVLFQVMTIDNENIEAQVLQVISGEVAEDRISIENKDIRLMGMLPDSNLYVGDYCVMSVKRYGNHYRKAWAALKADSGDYRTLKFYYSSHFSDIDALQYYVNSGGVEKDFQFDGVKVFVVAEDGEKKNITLPRTAYLPEEAAAEAFTDPMVESTVSNEIATTATMPKDPPANNLWIVTLIGLSLLVGLIGYVLGRWVRRKRSK